MTLCPLCHEGLRTSIGGFVDRRFSCGTRVVLGDVNQGPWCRVRQLERVLLEILPLAQHASCMHEEELADANDCCRWATVATAIETLNIKPKEAAEAVKQ